MKSIFFLASLLLTGISPAAEWFTVAGYPDDPKVDVVQIDPVPVQVQGDDVTMRVRVSRSAERRSARGVVFRSFEATARINCKSRTAYFLSSSFYAEPGFRGEPFRTDVFGPQELRPMAFREIPGNPSERIINAACKSLAN